MSRATGQLLIKLVIPGSCDDSRDQTCLRSKNKREGEFAYARHWKNVSLGWGHGISRLIHFAARASLSYCHELLLLHVHGWRGEGNPVMIRNVETFWTCILFNHALPVRCRRHWLVTLPARVALVIFCGFLLNVHSMSLSHCGNSSDDYQKFNISELKF